MGVECRRIRCIRMNPTQSSVNVLMTLCRAAFTRETISTRTLTELCLDEEFWVRSSGWSGRASEDHRKSTVCTVCVLDMHWNWDLGWESGGLYCRSWNAVAACKLVLWKRCLPQIECVTLNIKRIIFLVKIATPFSRKAEASEVIVTWIRKSWNRLRHSNPASQDKDLPQPCALSADWVGTTS